MTNSKVNLTTIPGAATTNTRVNGFEQNGDSMEIRQITGEELKTLKKNMRYSIAKEYGAYIVQEGDTLSHIGVGVGCEWHVLAELNKLDNPDLIFPGQVIKLV